RHVETGRRGDLGAMADEPALERSARSFGMELQREPVVADRERLVLAERRRGEMHGAAGQGERIAVPVQHVAAAAMAQARLAAGGRELDRRPADLLDAGRVDARAERARHELRPEANAERELARGEAPFDERAL